MEDDGASSAQALRRYLDLLRRRKWLLIASIFVAVAASLAVPLLQPPSYEGRAEVVLHLQNNDLLFGANSVQQSADPARVVPTEIRVLQSQEVRAAAAEKLGGVPPAVTASTVTGTDVIEVAARASTPGRASKITKAYANSYIELRRKQAVDNLIAAGQEVQSKVDEIQKQIDGAVGTQKDALIQAQALFKQRLDQLQVDAALKTGGADLVTPIQGATSRVNPRPVRVIAVGLALGLVLGIGLMFLFEHFDESLKVKEDLERFAPGLPVLGLIPAVEDWGPKDAAVAVSLRDPESPAAEAYRTLRTVIQFVGQDRPVQLIQVTSPNAEEGKSATVANLGLAIARTGQRVVIVCCDLRRPRLHEFFALPNDVGLTSVLRGEVPLDSALQSVPQQNRLRLLASGRQPKSPAEMLSSPRVRQLLEALRSSADVVLLDSPPVLPVTDALVLSGLVDALVLVAAQGVTTRREIARATQILRQVNAPLVGAVLNGVTGLASYGYGDGYYRRARDGAAEGARAPRSG